MIAKRVFTGTLLLLLVTVVTDIAASQNNSVALEGKHYALSMRILSQKTSASLSSGSRLDKKLANLCSISRFEGFVLDPDQSDIILIGQLSGRDRVLHLDDLVLHMRNIWSEGSPPICSLDPRSKDILEIQQIPSELGNIQTPKDGRRLIQRVKEAWGPQIISIGGIPRNARLAHVMIEADYHMKKVSLGAIQVAGIGSYLDKSVSADKRRFLEGEDIFAQRIGFNRFWFHVKEGFPTFFKEEGIIWLKECPIIILTEKQSIAASGELYDDTEDDPVAIEFSEGFSERFEKATEHVPSYAELNNLYILKAILEAMHFLNSPSDAGCDINYFLNSYRYGMETPMPNSMPGCVNYKEASLEGPKGGKKYWKFSTSFGGVYMEMKITEEQFERLKKLRRFRAAVLKARPSPDALFWTFITR